MACKFGKRQVYIYFNLLIYPMPQPGRMGMEPSRAAISNLVGVVQVRGLGFSRIQSPEGSMFDGTQILKYRHYEGMMCLRANVS